MVLDDSAVRCRIENALGRSWCCWRACMHRHVCLRTLCTVVNVCVCVCISVFVQCISVFVHLLRIYVNMRACTPTHSPTNARTGIETARGGSGGAAHAVPGCRNPRAGDMPTPVWIHLHIFTCIHLCIYRHVQRHHLSIHSHTCIYRHPQRHHPGASTAVAAAISGRRTA